MLEWLPPAGVPLSTLADKKAEKNWRLNGSISVTDAKKSSCFIHRHDEIRRLYSDGKIMSCYPWRLRIISPHDAPPARGARLAVIITKKNHPSAVFRNRIKRVIREYFRQHQCLRLPAADLLIDSRLPLNDIQKQKHLAALQQLFRLVEQRVIT